MSKIKIIGTYGHEKHRDIFNGFTIFELIIHKIESANINLPKVVVCSGIVPEYPVGTPVCVCGHIKQTEKHGKQVSIAEIKEMSYSISKTTEIIHATCKEIDTDFAVLIASAHKDIYDFCISEGAAKTIAKETGLSLGLCNKLCDKISVPCMQRKLLMLLSHHSVSWLSIIKIVEKYGVRAEKEVVADPYSVGMENGISFEVCDKIAKEIGISHQDPKRLKAAILEAFMQQSNLGHVYSSIKTICKSVNVILKNSAFEDKVSNNVLKNIIYESSDFVIEYFGDIETVYLKGLYDNECGIANEIARLNAASKALEYDDTIPLKVSRAAKVKYAPQQLACFDLLRKTGVKVITGGPGTGKTTVVKGLLAAYEQMNPNSIIKLCAPTGRAAQRMSETTNRDAITIHRLLGLTENNTTTKNIDADLIIVDESSMLDITIAHLFLSSVKDNAMVIFVGDINQLPSVGAGDFLNSIINAPQIQTVALKTVYRQGNESAIIQNAIAINSGVNAIIENNEFNLIRCSTEKELLNTTVIQMILNYNRKTPFDTQILCSSNKGTLGVFALNTLLQSILNPYSKNKSEFRYRKRIFRIGDKIIMKSNNYSNGYCNGDLGVIENVVKNGFNVNLSGKMVLINKNNIDDVELAYAITIHKSQGSEMKNAIVVVPKNPTSMLKRNMIYTAVTRAKNKVIVISEKDAINIAIETVNTGIRRSLLRERLPFGENPSIEFKGEKKNDEY